METPDFTLSRSGNDVTITIRNRDDKTAHIYRSDQHNTTLTEIDSITSDTFNETLAAGKNAGYAIRYAELDASVTITENNTDQTPPYYVATARSGVTFTTGTASFNPSWGASVTYDTIDIDPFLQGKRSIRKYTKE